MNRNQPILFLSHDASQTGAPIDLLRFLRWMKENNAGQRFVVALKAGGPLIDDFEELCAVYRLPALPHEPISCIFANTLAVLDTVNQLSLLNCPVVVYARELEYVIQRMCDRDLLLRDLADYYLADSRAVKNNLEQTYYIKPEKVKCILEGVPLLTYTDDEKKRRRRLVRDEIGLPKDAFVVAACGTIDWRKGADIFLQIARSVEKSSIHFIWVGDSYNRDFMDQLTYDIRKLKLAAKVHFIGPRANPRDYMVASDVYLVTAREEPLSIAMLEAASVGLPVICFKGAGGPEEFVEQEAGITVPYGDVQAAAQAIAYLYQSPHERQYHGEMARQKIAKHHNLDHTAPQILTIINQAIQIKERQV